MSESQTVCGITQFHDTYDHDELLSFESSSISLLLVLFPRCDMRWLLFHCLSGHLFSTSFFLCFWFFSFVFCFMGCFIYTYIHISRWSALSDSVCLADLQASKRIVDVIRWRVTSHGFKARLCFGFIVCLRMNRLWEARALGRLWRKEKIPGWWVLHGSSESFSLWKFL